MMSNINPFKSFIDAYDKIVVVTHERPDADAIGSLVAMYRCLRGLGKDAYLQFSNDVPAKLKFLLEDPELMERRVITISDNYEAAIVLDCSDQERTMFNSDAVLWNFPLLNIDHHPGNTLFGSSNIHDDTAAATGQMLYRLFAENKVVLNQRIAEALYTAIVGDTGGFKYSNTTSEVHLIASELLKFDIQPHDIMARILDSMSLKAFNFLRDALKTVQFTGLIATMTIEYNLMEQHKISNAELPELVNYLRGIGEVRVSLLFIEIEPDSVNISLRSEPGIDISYVARHFGGGGHKLASGCSIDGKLTDVVKDVVTFTQKYLGQ